MSSIDYHIVGTKGELVIARTEHNPEDVVVVGVIRPMKGFCVYEHLSSDKPPSVKRHADESLNNGQNSPEDKQVVYKGDTMYFAHDGTEFELEVNMEFPLLFKF